MGVIVNKQVTTYMHRIMHSDAGVSTYRNVWERLWNWWKQTMEIGTILELIKSLWRSLYDLTLTWFLPHSLSMGYHQPTKYHKILMPNALWDNLSYLETQQATVAWQWAVAAVTLCLVMENFSPPWASQIELSFFSPSIQPCSLSACSWVVSQTQLTVQWPVAI